MILFVLITPPGGLFPGGKDRSTDWGEKSEDRETFTLGVY